MEKECSARNVVLNFWILTQIYLENFKLIRGGKKSPCSDEEVQVITLEGCRALMELPPPWDPDLPGLQGTMLLLRVAHRDLEQLCQGWSWQCWEPQGLESTETSLPGSHRAQVGTKAGWRRSGRERNRGRQGGC